MGAGLALVLALSSAVAVVDGPHEVSAAAPTVHFSAAGDFAATTSTAAVLSRMRGQAPELALALGDLSYGTSTGEQDWCDFVTARMGQGFPFQLISGNHESDGQNGDINDFSACLPNQLPGLVGTYGRQWYVDHPRLSPTTRFVMISPGLTFPEGDWSYAAGSPRYQWTAAAIDGARAAGIPWVVVGVHKPCITMGQYSCDGQSDINNLLLAKRVDLVLNGHEHLYQRTKQLSLGAGCTALGIGTYNASCVVDADDVLVKGAGTVVATVGTGGTYLRDVNATDSEAEYFRTWSGANASPSHGFLDVTADSTALRARFIAATGAYTDDFTVAASTDPPANTAPAAHFREPSCVGRTCDFDASMSSDVDGTISRYEWSFGGDAAAEGVRASHTFAADGTHPVTLKVTDDDGAVGSVTRHVTVSTQTTIALDTFTRTVTGGFGSADRGGSWVFSGSAADASVSGGVGRLVLRTPGIGQSATLPGLSPTTRADLALSVRFDKLATGGGAYVYARGRRVGTAGNYRARLRLLSNGSVTLALDRNDASFAQTTIVADTVAAGLTYVPGEQLRLRVQALGTAPTQLRAKVWKVGGAEPSTWTVSATDATPALQAAGDVGVQTYLSSSATNTPVTVQVDDVLVTSSSA